MKVKIIDRKIYLPKEILEEANLPERGLCEVIVVGDEIRIRRPVLESLNLFEMLKTPIQQNIDEMVEVEEVEDV
ncbi:MAG: hypothetical protein QW638_05040 [Candidatus Bathyarchaeia archaeon]|nr:hypothetical protein [Candidatus Bathyarchaeota archaeon]